ncbi:MAG: hypothetical protein E3K32_12760 [wastewater metagenome]|nr:hypothetical protein [Candidatus Loosdrechtia aerotolerans]
MKKLVVVMLLVLMFGCGKRETGEVEKGTASEKRVRSEVVSNKEHDFIKNEEGFVVHMKDIKLLLKHLSMSINQENWEDIKEDTKRLKKASPVVFTGNNKDDLPVEFINLDVKFHLSALELIGACQKRDKDKATAAFFKVVNSCDECHAKFNTKETSASWFQ